MQETAHITRDRAEAVSRAIRNKGGVFIGSADWCESCGITPDEYTAFLDVDGKGDRAW